MEKFSGQQKGFKRAKSDPTSVNLMCLIYSIFSKERFAKDSLTE